MKPLAISSKQRSKYLPDVPAIIETLPSPFCGHLQRPYGAEAYTQGGHPHDLGGNRCRRKNSGVLERLSGSRRTVGDDVPEWRRRSPPICNVGVPSQTTLHRKGSKRATAKLPIRTMIRPPEIIARTSAAQCARQPTISRKMGGGAFIHESSIHPNHVRRSIV